MAGVLRKAHGVLLRNNSCRFGQKVILFHKFIWNPDKVELGSFQFVLFCSIWSTVFKRLLVKVDCETPVLYRQCKIMIISLARPDHWSGSLISNPPKYYLIKCTVLQSMPQLLNDFLLRQYALGDRMWAGITRYNLIKNWTNITCVCSVRTRTKQLRAPLTTTTTLVYLKTVSAYSTHVRSIVDWNIIT